MSRSSQQGPHLIRSAGIISAATVTSRVLGLVRDQVLAYFFGAGDAMDAFRIAFRLPNTLRDLFAEGALSAALVPTFARALEADRQRTWRIASNIVNVLFVLSLVVITAGMVFAEPLIGLYASGFKEVPGKFELTVRLARIMFPFVAMVGVAAVLMALLNALHCFFVPALSPATFNVATILSVLILAPFAPRFGVEPVMVVAVGTLGGGLGQVLLQWPSAAREGFRYVPVLDLHDPWLRQAARLIVPGVVGLAAVQINLFVNGWLASGLGTGAVSWLDYAFRLMYMPIGLFGISIATASLPNISRHVASNDMRKVGSAVSRSLRLMLMLNVPATVGLVVLASPIVSLIFERGQFTRTDTLGTTAALVWYAPGLVGYSAVKLASPVFYALGNSRIPVVASALSVTVNIVLSLVLVRTMGHRGLALGTAVGALVNAGLLLTLLRSRLEGLESRRVLIALIKISIASAAMAVVAYGTERLLRVPLPGSTVLVESGRVFGAIGAGMAVLGMSAHFLHIEEFAELTRRLTGGETVT